MTADIRLIETIPQGNPLWPLPADYPELTIEGQRMARINGCRQWMFPTTDLGRRALNFIGSMELFEQYYLWPDLDSDFDSGFFDTQPFETPEPHRVIYREWAIRKLSLVIAPRGGMKSSACHKAIILRLLSHPKYSITYASSTHENSVLPGQKLKDQVTHNERIQDDWIPEYGRLKPPKGDAPWSESRLQLANRSSLRCISAMGKSRGGRPRLFILDDPEWDPKASTDMTLLRLGMEHLLFTTIRPMITRPLTALWWVATIISRRHYAWKAVETQDTPDGPRAVDHRFNYWSRTILDSIYRDETGKQVSFCPRMWPLTRADKAADPTLSDCDSLEELEEQMGHSRFMAEMRARPGAFEGGFFPSHDVKKHGWWLENIDGEFGTRPSHSRAMMCWHDSRGEFQREPLVQFLSNSCRLFQPADSSYTSGPSSDPKATTVLAITPDNILFVLDLWAARCTENVFIRECLQLSDKWLVPIIAPEVVKESWSFFTNLDAVIRQRELQAFGVTHMPVAKPLKPPPKIDKNGKISGLLYRWVHGLVKLPLWMQGQPMWQDLFNQIEGFNPMLEDGGLANDDLLDCVAMSQQIVKWRLPPRGATEIQDETPFDRLAAGQLHDQRLGVPTASLVDWSRVSAEEILDVIARRQREERTPESVI